MFSEREPLQLIFDLYSAEVLRSVLLCTAAHGTAEWTSYQCVLALTLCNYAGIISALFREEDFFGLICVCVCA